MATIEYWIQLENRPWDASPNNIDRITGKNMQDITGRPSVLVTLTSPVTGAIRTRRMYNPTWDSSNNRAADALILRRYTANWAAPDDRKVNPWDLNEKDPTDNGTMGTIPGPVIECNVGDRVIVHFRNWDMRAVDIEKRVHSLHPHGFVFKTTSDGAYPLNPPDPTQPVGAEAALWATVPGFSGTLKKGDRIPPTGTFTYTWDTAGWPTTAGVWLYHDHSICDMENVELGAIGIIVIHNPADVENEVDIRANDPSDLTKYDPAFLPCGAHNGLPTKVTCHPFPGINPTILPFDLEGLGSPIRIDGLGDMDEASHGHESVTAVSDLKIHGGKEDECDSKCEVPLFSRVIQRDGLILQLNKNLTAIAKLCTCRYCQPPSKALYLQLFHMVTGASGMMINGRSYLGNTPTMIAGRDTRMRFGVVGMGTGGSGIHTFHIHGHRWIIPGPQGNTPLAIQGSPQVSPVSQFEDTRIFGPANSFGFTVHGQAGSFMRAGGPAPDDALGEWHMHCHVLDHMMTGMMGSLLIIRGGEICLSLPKGVPCEHTGGGGVGTTTIVVKNVAFTPNALTVASGTTVTFDFQEANHTVQTTGTTGTASPINISNGSPPGPFNPFSAVPSPSNVPVVVTGNPGNVISYQCGIHGAGMAGTITIL